MIDMSTIKMLSVEQKLQIMEAIWQDLSGEEDVVQSPSWHGEALRETKQRHKEGKEDVIEWRERSIIEDAGTFEKGVKP